MEQFFGKTTWVTFGGLAAAVILSILVRYTPLALPILFALGVGAAWLYIRRPSAALLVAFAELFAFSHGHLIEANIGPVVLTERIVIFAGILLGWGVRVLWKREVPHLRDLILQPWVLVAGAVVSGLLVGMQENNPLTALDDANGYFFALYLLPLASVAWSRDMCRQLLHVFTATALWVAIFSLGTLYLFTHLDGIALVPLYKFIRDARIGEITLMSGGYWRIFLQSQIILIPTLFLLVAFAWERSRAERTWVWSLLLAGIVLSLSRSFWLGGMVGGTFLFLLLVRKSFSRTLRLAGRLVAHVGGSLLLIVALVFLVFPLPTRVSNLQDVFTKRGTEFGDAAISSRWKLLPIMWDGTQEHLWRGNGFGKGLEVQSDDPRIRAQYPEGRWTTHAFEWGWLDLWLKMGVLGLVAFLWLFAAYFRALWHADDQPFWLRAGFSAGLLTLAVVHAFSPYLNHPLGLGFFLFITPFILRESRQNPYSLAKNPVSKEAFPLRAGAA
ncbi:O-antigen ligase family protein [Candidatus Uhrbacteria bacterium]|nr:O-antigen ligase family protein [Candidatus Uhrbacteria bacterium]